MNASKLKEGMIVKFSSGNVVKVTHVPTLDKYGECFFSGILIEYKNQFYKQYLNKNLKNNWNSAFCHPI